jgi:hypothetical protein
MTITSSGKVSLNNIQTEFGGTNPIRMSEYYTNNGSGYTSGISGIPSSGTTIRVSQFYGKSKTLPVAATSLDNTYIRSPTFGVTPTLGFQSNFWFNTTATGAGLLTMWMSNLTNNYAGLNTFVDGSGKFAAYIRYNNNSMYWQTASSQSVNDGNWHNVHIKYASSMLYISVDNGAFCSFSTGTNGSILDDQNYGNYQIGLNFNQATLLCALLYFDYYNYSPITASTFFSSTSKAVNNSGAGNNIDGSGDPLIWLKNSGSNFYVNAQGNFSVFTSGSGLATSSNTSLTY